VKQLTAQAIIDIGGPRANPAIAAGTIASLAWLDTYGISQPARLAHFLAQCGEESDHFHTLREYASGAAYEGRRDLGNTFPGDGVLFAGRGLIEDTGRANYRAFTAWIRKQIPDAPDFEANPKLLETFPWALYSAVWYWTSHNLNVLADEDNIEAITHKVNGGLNGLGERLVMLGRASLVLLGYGTTDADMKHFQGNLGLTPDGVLGAKTRAALHAQLLALPAMTPATLAVHAPPAAPVAAEGPAVVRPAPVEPVHMPVPVAVPQVIFKPLPPPAPQSWWGRLLAFFGL
jgi:predicted chitinase